jgi:hypothetical protein
LGSTQRRKQKEEDQKAKRDAGWNVVPLECPARDRQWPGL